MRVTAARKPRDGSGSQTHTVAVKAVLDRWLSPDHRYFKVTGDDGDLYIIRHDPRQGLWELTFYRIADTP